ncbi:zinc ribbon domain-containing protein [Stygiolobus caldivivus]|uniref:Zinc ribbon domain-containing protein n=2 Tax=Stygiolobus caldivivus TaxID=2824673 RepID=A0A8D5U9A8_9CREN|nr:zinc ribbon domain-containing protein [Stygiolobus caldivivus]
MSFPQQTSNTVTFPTPSSQTIKFNQPSLIQCPRCGTNNVPEANFCKKCGFRLNSPLQQYVPDQQTLKVQPQFSPQPTVSYPPQQLPTSTLPQFPMGQQFPVGQGSVNKSVETGKKPSGPRNKKKKILKAVVADVAFIAIALLALSVVLPYFFDIILLPPLYIPPPAKGVTSLTPVQLDSVLGDLNWNLVLKTSNLSLIYSYVMGEKVSLIQGAMAGLLEEYSSGGVNVYSVYINTSSNTIAQDILTYITSNSVYYTSSNTIKCMSLVNGYTVYIARGGNVLEGVTAFGDWVVVVLITFPPQLLYSTPQLNSLISDMEITNTF